MDNFTLEEYKKLCDKLSFMDGVIHKRAELLLELLGQHEMLTGYFEDLYLCDDDNFTIEYSNPMDRNNILDFNFSSNVLLTENGFKKFTEQIKNGHVF